MRRKVQAGVLAGIVLCLLPGTMCSHALAEESRITKVSLEITADFEQGEDVREEDIQIYTDSSLYKIDEWKLLNEELKWEGMTVPVVEIVLSQADEPKFSYIGANNLTVKGTKFTFVSSKRSEKDTILNLIIKLPPIEGEIERIEGWEINLDHHGIVSWPYSDSISLYKLEIYRGGTKIGEQSTYGTVASIQGMITQPGNYSVKLSGVSKYEGTWSGYGGRGEAVYFGQDQIDAFDEPAQSLEGSWIENSGFWYYANPGDHLAVAQWQEIEGKWYFFNTQGVMVTGWVEWNKKRYYCSQDGAMLTDSVTPDGYRVGTDGAVIGKEN